MAQDEQKNTFESEEEVYYGVGSFLWEVVKVFFWALVIIVPIRVFLLQPFFVQGASMEPNFHDGDYLIINELGFKETKIPSEKLDIFTVDSFRELERGDVAVFRYPRNPQQFFIKRIIGLPGEVVRIDNGKVIVINEQNPAGTVLDEHLYLPQDLMTSGNVDRRLAADEYFVLGDNRGASHDSRAWGALPKSDVIGRVLLRAWPLDKAAIF